MKNIASITLKLFVITVVAAALLGLVYSITKEPIAQQVEKAANESRLAAFPEAASFEEAKADIPKDSIIKNVFYALDKDGNKIGATFGITTRGYSPGLMMTVGIGADGKIKGVIIGDNTETPSIGKKAIASGFLDQFTGKPYDKPLQYALRGLLLLRRGQAILARQQRPRPVAKPHAAGKGAGHHICCPGRRRAVPCSRASEGMLR
jgi:electron transport complex protein RnfG